MWLTLGSFVFFTALVFLPFIAKLLLALVPTAVLIWFDRRR